MSNEIRDSKLLPYESRILETTSGLFGYFTKTSFKILKEIFAKTGEPLAAMALEGAVTTYISHLSIALLYCFREFFT